MSGSIQHLAPVLAFRELGSHNVDHPMRVVTRDAANSNAWDASTAATVGSLFDSMAAEWHEKHSDTERTASLADALDRGALPAGRLVELGCGTGAGTAVISERRDVSAAIDLSAGMLAHADPANAPLVRADASTLPFPDECADVLVLLNMLLFPVEVDRILAPGGVIVWVNTGGEATPIHLTAEELVEALPGPWDAVASRAGTGTWAVARRGRHSA